MNLAAKACHGGAMHCHSLSHWTGADSLVFGIGVAVLIMIVVAFINNMRN